MTRARSRYSDAECRAVESSSDRLGHLRERLKTKRDRRRDMPRVIVYDHTFTSELRDK